MHYTWKNARIGAVNNAVISREGIKGLKLRQNYDCSTGMASCGRRSSAAVEKRLVHKAFILPCFSTAAPGKERPPPHFEGLYTVPYLKDTLIRRLLKSPLLVLLVGKIHSRLLRCSIARGPPSHSGKNQCKMCNMNKLCKKLLKWLTLSHIKII